MKSKSSGKSGGLGFGFACVTAAAAAALASPTASAAITTTTSGVYDEQMVQANTIDQSASGATAINATLLPLSQFKTDVAAAYLAGTGGVINFEDATAGSSHSQILARYGPGNASTLTLTNPYFSSSPTAAAGYQIDMNAAAAIAAAPISGGVYLRTNGNAIQAFDFSAPVGEVGFTILARSAARTVNVTLTYDDGSTGTLGPITVAQVSGSGAASSPDTFFGFTAPADRTIAGLKIDPGANNYFVLDDLAFVTAPVPEPGTLALAAFAAIPLLTRRRHRKVL